MKKKQPLSTNKRTIKNRITVSITYNRYLRNISNIITKKWSIFQIANSLQKVFDKKPVVTYKRNKNLGKLLGGHTLQGRNFFKTNL